MDFQDLNLFTSSIFGEFGELYLPTLMYFAKVWKSTWKQAL